MNPGTPLYEFITSITARNLVFGGLLGLFPLWSLNRTLSTSVIGGSVTSVAILLTGIAGWVINTLFAASAATEYLGPLCLVLVIAALAPLSDALIRMIVPAQRVRIGNNMEYLTANTAVMMAGLTILIPGTRANIPTGFVEYMADILGLATGYLIAAILIASVRTRRRITLQTPGATEGIPLFLFTAGMISLVFLGFSYLGTTGGAR